MTSIGTFKPDKDGYSGTIRTLAFKAHIRILPNPKKDRPTSPDFRVFAGTAEIGAAWLKIRPGTETSYLSVRLDDPSLAAPIHAALTEHTPDGTLRLFWRRDKSQGR